MTYFSKIKQKIVELKEKYRIDGKDLVVFDNPTTRGVLVDHWHSSAVKIKHKFYIGESGKALIRFYGEGK